MLIPIGVNPAEKRPKVARKNDKLNVSISRICLIARNRYLVRPLLLEQGRQGREPDRAERRIVDLLAASLESEGVGARSVTRTLEGPFSAVSKPILRFVLLTVEA